MTSLTYAFVFFEGLTSNGAVEQRFAKLARFLPFLPVYGGGTTRFQPVYVDDLARAVEVISRMDPSIESQISGKIIEAGGPDSKYIPMLFSRNWTNRTQYTHSGNLWSWSWSTQIGADLLSHFLFHLVIFKVQC